MKFARFAAATLTGAAVLAFSPAPLLAQGQPEQITETDIINGTMSIDFATRTHKDTSGDYKEGSPALNAQDRYKFDLYVAKTTEFVGEITRQPNIYTKILQKRKQDARLSYSIDLFVLNPKDLKQKKAVGKWAGIVPIDTATGAYDLAGGKSLDSPLRIRVDAIGKAPSFEDLFRGKLFGKSEQKDNLASYTYKRLVGNKTVQIQVQHTDPMRFENVVLAKGPAESYPSTTVSGRLDYDYDLYNWLTDGIRFKYTLDGQEVEDIVTGSIKWVEDSDYESTGKGYYDFNLRFNEEKNKSASTEGEAFEKMSDEDAFFAVDNSIPCLTGRISYVDTFADGDTVASSQITYNLNANKLTKQQVVNFFKLWMIAVGPTNDD
jgi:hypothetical protein